MPPAASVTASAPASAAAQVAAHPPPAPLLRPSQITGIAIGAFAVAVVIFFLIAWLVSHLRRRKSKDASRSPPVQKIRSGNSRFGTLDRQLPHSHYETAVYEKNDSMPEKPPAINTSFPSVDPAQIGVAVSPESQQPQAAPVDHTPVSAHSTDSFANLIPKQPPPKIKVAVPAFSTQRRRTESTDTMIDDQAQDMAYKKIQFPSPPSTHTERFGPPSPHGPAHLPYSSTPKASRVPAAKVKAPPPAAVRVNPPIPKIRKQAADRTSTQTIISNEPMSPKSPLMNPFQEVCPSPAPFNPTDEYIPSYYYTSSQTPTASTFPSSVQQNTLSAELPKPQSHPPRFLPQPAPPSLLNSASLPKRPSKRTPPPLPPPPSFETSKTLPPAPSTARPEIAAPRPGNAPPLPSKKQPPPRPAVRLSTASAASVETIFDDQDSPADEQAQRALSPVPEAPSPAVSTRHPRLPHIANQAASQRSSSAHSSEASAPSTSSIAAKRKGSDAADELQKGLWITGSNGRTVNDRGRFPVRASSKSSLSARSSPAGKAPRVDKPLASPVWTPSLTPKRTATGDLVLEVD